MAFSCEVLSVVIVLLSVLHSSFSLPALQQPGAVALSQPSGPSASVSP